MISLKNMLYDSLFQLLDKIPHKELMDQYMHLIGYLSITPEVTLQKFLDSLQEIQSNGLIQVAYTLEDGRFFLHGTATLHYETKLSHGCHPVGHIEDVVVAPNYRNLGIAKKLIDILLCTASTTCYKVVLDCNEELIPVYAKCGFTPTGIHMSHRFL
jgi:GNAT superfamily N-acetyltransferase